MKKIFFLTVCFILSQLVNAQNKDFILGISTNLLAYTQHRYGIDLIGNLPNNKYQFLAGINLIGGTTNMNQKRTLPEYNADYMKKANDQLSGWGYNIQARKLIYAKTYDYLSSDLLMYVSLNYNQQNNKISYWQNEYNLRNNLYYYELVKHKGNLRSQSLQSQLVVFQKGRYFFSEFGLGIGYNFITQNQHLKETRKYNKYVTDIGYNAFMPVFSLRIGFYLFK